jgi:FtsP/CotA-like multicopper oxidase with cupredoxin domain
VIVDVENRLVATETAVHWHGLLQRGTPYMDGATFITQCPISEGATFRYTFVASELGTYFWHSHHGT